MKIQISDETLRDLKPPDDKPQLLVFDTKLTGFGVVVGQRMTTFIINRRVDGKLRREALRMEGPRRRHGCTQRTQGSAHPPR